MKIYAQEEMAKHFKEIVLKKYRDKIEPKHYCDHFNSDKVGYTDKVDLNRDVFYYAEHFVEGKEGWHDATITFIEDAGIAILRDGTKVVCSWSTSDYFIETTDWEKDISTYTLKEDKKNDR